MIKKLYTEFQETKKEIKNKRDYKRLSIHAFMWSKCELFALCRVKTNSFSPPVWITKG